MKKFNLVVMAWLSVIVNTCAQSPAWNWAGVIGGNSNEEGASIAVDAAGNVYSTGNFGSTADFDPGPDTFNITTGVNYDIYISKLDASGNFKWAKNVGSIQSDLAYDIITDANGNVYTTGYFYGTADFDPGPATYYLTTTGINMDVFILKLDSSGNFVWAKRMGGTSFDIALGIALDQSSNVYTTGYFYNTADFDPGTGTFNLTAPGIESDVFISKLDSAGNFIWAKQMGGFGADIGTSIAINTAGNGEIYTTGYFRATADFDPGTGTFNLTAAGTDPDAFVTKFDSSGNFTWAKQMGGSGGDIGRDIAIDMAGSGDIYIGGWFRSTADFDPGPAIFNLTASGNLADMYITRLDTAGNFVWAKPLGGSINDDWLYSIAIDPSGNGNVYATGKFSDTADFDPGAATFHLVSAGASDIFVCRLGGGGNFIWAKSTGGPLVDEGRGIALDATSHAHTTGFFNSSSIPLDSITITNHSANADAFIAQLGNTIISGIADVQVADNPIILFPNPCNGKFKIKSPDLKFYQLQIFNVIGKSIYSTVLKDEDIELNVPSGIYFVKLNDGEKSYCRKLIVEHDSK